MESEANKRKADSKLKILKDLSFLLELEPQEIDQRNTKYVLEQGKGMLISELDHQFSIVYSCKTYDYQGHFIKEFAEGKISKSDKKDSDFLRLLMTMRLGERAWLNQRLEEEGQHHEVVALRVEYKNDETMEAKRKVNFQKNQEAKTLFQAGHYQEALKIYKFLFDITNNYSRRILSEGDIFEIEEMAIKAKRNYIKTFFKMVSSRHFLVEEVEKQAKHFLDTLRELQPNSSVTRYLQAKWLLRDGLLDAALDEAKASLKIESNTATLQLVQAIQEEIRHKGKIKVKKTDLIQPQSNQ